MRIYPIAALVFSVATMSAAEGCGSHPVDPASVQPSGARVWQTTNGKKHPLVGRFFQNDGWKEVRESDLYDASAAATFVLVGEKHDNPDHHVEQARILGGMLERKKRPAVVLEMIETDMQDKLTGYMEHLDASAAGFGEAMSWESRGWGPYENYKPIFDVAFSAKLTLVPGGIPIARAMDISHHGEAALSQEDLKTYLIDQPMDPMLESSLHEELVQAHCGHLPSTMVRGMLLAERARDAGLANALVANEKTGAILIAGNGHTRTDRGVPWVLKKLAPDAKVVSIALEEVDDTKSAPSAYDIHADYTFFTPRETDEDPCVKFMEEMKKRKKKDPAL